MGDDPQQTNLEQTFDRQIGYSLEYFQKNPSTPANLDIPSLTFFLAQEQPEGHPVTRVFLNYKSQGVGWAYAPREYGAPSIQQLEQSILAYLEAKGISISIPTPWVV